jgi:hypothetical protein
MSLNRDEEWCLISTWLFSPMDRNSPGQATQLEKAWQRKYQYRTLPNLARTIGSYHYW